VLLQGLLLPDEINVWDRDLAQQRLSHKRALESDRDREAAKKRAKLAPVRTTVDLGRADAVMVLTDGATAGASPTPADLIRAAGAYHTASAITATVMIARAPAALEFAHQWAVFLSGCIVCNHEALLGKPGASIISFDAAIKFGGWDVGCTSRGSSPS